MKERNGEHPAGDAMQLVFLAAFIIVWAADSFFLHISTFLAGRVHILIRAAVLAAAVIISIQLLKSGHAAVSDEKGPQRILSEGAFAYVRHPLYLAALLFYTGLSVITLSLISLGLFVVIFIFYDYIASYEEKIMVERFGDEYERYRKSTGKWLPKSL